VWWAFIPCFSSFLIIAFTVAEYLLYNYKMAAISTAMNHLASSALCHARHVRGKAFRVLGSAILGCLSCSSSRE
jgi:uncharacterized protein (DUF2062 family)